MQGDAPASGSKGHPYNQPFVVSRHCTAGAHEWREGRRCGHPLRSTRRSAPRRFGSRGRRFPAFQWRMLAESTGPVPSTGRGGRALSWLQRSAAAARLASQLGASTLHPAQSTKKRSLILIGVPLKLAWALTIHEDGNKKLPGCIEVCRAQPGQANARMLIRMVNI